MKLDEARKQLLKDPEFKKVYEEPDALLDEGSYFTWIESRGRGSRSNETWSMPCKATIIGRKGQVVTAIIDEPAGGTKTQTTTDSLSTPTKKVCI
jgi:hypothetical protein